MIAQLQVQPIAFERRDTLLVVHVCGPVAYEEIAAIAAACEEGCTEVLLNLSSAVNLSLPTLSAMADAVPLHLSVAFCSIPPSLLHRIGRDVIASFGRVLDD